MKILIGMVCLFVGFGLAYNMRKPDVNSGEFWQGTPAYTLRVSQPWPHPTPTLYASPAARPRRPTLPRPPEMASQRKEHIPPRPPEFTGRGEYAVARFVEATGTDDALESEAVRAELIKVDNQLPLVIVAQ